MSWHKTGFILSIAVWAWVICKRTAWTKPMEVQYGVRQNK